MDDLTKPNEHSMKANKNHKDSVFTLLFKEKKERLVSLYNALSGSSYSDDVEIDINTLEDALVLNRLNDISFEIDGRIVVLIEYQSTLNQNMPFRCWLYAARVYEKIMGGKNIYRDSLIKLPKPEVYVCYNGERRLEDKYRVMKLSDAFMADGTKGEFEFTVKVFDVNKKRGGEILHKSKVLAEYAEFIETVRSVKRTGVNLNEAMAEAIRVCIKNDVLKEFLMRHGSEVCNMLFVEFDIDEAKEVWREEGIEKGKIEVIKNFLEIGESVEKIAKATQFSVKKIQEIKDEAENEMKAL